VEGPRGSTFTGQYSGSGFNEPQVSKSVGGLAVPLYA
jgi:hypothetical protein